jgi:hypothetical protein
VYNCITFFIFSCDKQDAKINPKSALKIENSQEEIRKGQKEMIMEPSTKVKIRFTLSPALKGEDNPNTNSYKIYIDGELAIDKSFVDYSNGHIIPEAIIEVEKGKHIIKSIFREKNASNTLELNIDKDIGISTGWYKTEGVWFGKFNYGFITKNVRE